MGADYVAEVDPTDGKVLNRIRTGNGAHQLFTSPDGKLVYVNNRVGGTITVLDSASLAILHTYRVPGGPDDLAFAPDGSIWITCRFIEKIAVLNPTTGELRTVGVGRQPHGIFLNATAP